MTVKQFRAPRAVRIMTKELPAMLKSCVHEEEKATHYSELLPKIVVRPTNTVRPPSIHLEDFQGWDAPQEEVAREVVYGKRHVHDQAPRWTAEFSRRGFARWY